METSSSARARAIVRALTSETILCKLGAGARIGVRRALDRAIPSRAVSSRRSAARARADMDVHFVYVLECERGAYYVGVAKSVPDRVAEHVAGRGATWCRLHRPLRVAREIAFASRASALEGEDVELKRLMLRHGVDAVRGGSYARPNLTREQRAALDGEIAHREGRCLRCGRRSHGAKDCFARAHVNGYALSAPEGSRSPNRDGRSGRPRCARCGRGSHVARDCFATFSIDGERLGERRSNAEPSSEYESAEETFMM